jgi:hypothetical protein
VEVSGRWCTDKGLAAVLFAVVRASDLDVPAAHEPPPRYLAFMAFFLCAPVSLRFFGFGFGVCGR